MVISNTRQRYGLVSILLHWVMALLIFGLFGLGLYMTDLGYYDPWYRQGPDLHRSIGVVVVILLFLRLLWKKLSPLPLALSSQKAWELRLAGIVHSVFYGLILLIAISGYLISTADGRAVSVFGLFEIPALISDIDGQEDVAGLIHFWLAWLMMGLVALHALGALKHQIIDKDGTMMRMLGGESRQNKSARSN
ncbi:cytochrome b [Motiliproteus sp. MSK22-1]|uniref:cytochrome b n=1 Tax=Motiliproteus sp. MSK22-1 TaxID=1897630 RepID=UPI0009768C6C|nr:cytochrome b [Motiliproteus sp. MSK22-1]OMH39252.1 cytochrome B [Motiliproteus sp. MSK22-1]